MKKLIALAFLLAFSTSVSAGVVLGPMTSGSTQGGGSGHAPVVTAKNCTVSSGFTNGQTVMQVHTGGACAFSALCNSVACSGTDAITIWAISAQSCANCYSISAAGVLQGGSNSGNVTGFPETDTVTVTATNSTGTSPGVTQTITSYADGSVTGPGGTPQAPTLLSGGAYSGQNWSTRPAWNVAAVDYAVASLAQLMTHCGALTPWTSVATSGTSISGQNFNITGNNVLLTCIDFSASNGAQILVSGSNASITWSSMKYTSTNQASGNQSILNQTGGSGLTLNNNVINGNCDVAGGSDTAQSSLIIVSAGPTGTLTMEYNLFENFRQHVLEDNANHNIIYNYNYVYNGGSCESGPHLNYLQSGNNNGTQTWIANLNTTYQPVQPQAGGEGFQAYSNSGSGNGKTVATLAYNTMIYGPNGEGRTHMTTSLGSNCSTGCTTTGSAYGNYIDYRGGVAFYGDPNACPGGSPPQQNTYGAACSSGKASNINPVNGATITTTP